MIHIIHCPEFHYSLANEKNTLYAMSEVAKTARKYKELGDIVITISSGDLHDRSIQATERQGFTKLVDAVAEIAASSSRFFMMYGTRSTHDIEGSYKAYSFIPNVVLLDRNSRSYSDSEISVFSLEEPMPSEYKNEDIIAYTNRTVLAAKMFFDQNEGKAKILMVHGIILCNETVNTPATNFGGVHYNERQLVDTGAHVALAGHLHKGYQFSEIPGGYAHSLAHTFSDDGFIPDFKIYSYSHLECVEPIETVTLDLPARFNVNVTATVEKIEISNISNIESVHSSSMTNTIVIKPRVEIEKSANTTAVRQRIVDEIKSRYPYAEVEYPELKEIRENKARNVELNSAHSYREQAKLVYPDWTEKDFEAMDWLEQEDQKDGTIPSDLVITPKYVDVRGYKPFKNGLKKDQIHIDFSSYGMSVVGIVAPGGSGKSSLSDLVFPHPECLSQPAMKTELFGLSDSFIRQSFDVNGDEVLCEISGNVETGKFVYFCSVNGVEKCKKGLREYKEVVSQIFGPIHEYALTVVRTQFRFPRTIDGAVANPDIKYATNKELKDIYNSLIGNDKTATQKRCKEKADAFKASSVELTNKLSGIKSSIESIVSDEIDEFAVATAISAESVRLSTINNEIEATVSSIATISANVEKRSDIEKRYKAARIDLMDAEEKLDIPGSNAKISALEAESGNVESYRAEIQKIDAITKQNEGIVEGNNKANQSYTTAYSEWSERRNAVMKKREEISTAANAEKSVLESAKTAKQRRESEIAQIEQWISLVKSCPKCGYVDADVESQRKEKTDALAAAKLLLIEDGKVIPVMEAKIDSFRKEYAECVFNEAEPTKPVPVPLLPCGDRASLQLKIDSAQSGLVKIAEIKAKIEAGQKDIIRLKNDVATLKDALDLIPDVSEERNALLLKKSNLEIERDSCQKSIDDLKAKLAKSEQNKETLVKLRADSDLCKLSINEAENGFNDWSRYQKAWGKDGIPARFIELEAPIVDATVNEMLAQFYPKLYVESKTVRTGSDGKVVDDFDVKIYNTEEGTEQSLYSISGEQANFVLSAMYFAFRQAYMRNKHVNVTVCVEDEPDANVGIEKQGAFCDMVRYQQNIENKQRLYISHSGEVQSLLENVLYLQEL